MQKKEILRAYGTAYQEMTERLLAEADLAGLIGSRDARILIKPNLVTPSPADFGATTHPELIAGIIAYLQENGFRKITIAEGSWVGDRTAEAFEYCGYRGLAERFGVNLLDTQKDGHHAQDCAGMELHINDCVKDADFLINVPVLKGHCQTRVTCALKNMKGLIPNSEKRRFHTMGLHEPIAHLNTVIRQDFIVVDHICGDPAFEEGGNPLVRNCVMAARDPVLVDAYACALLGHELSDVPYIGRAGELGVGCADLSEMILRTIEGDDSVDVPQEEHLLSVRYAVSEWDSCSACYAALVPALEQLREEGLLDDLPAPIGIGQGHQGKSGAIGVGNCTSGFEVCVRGCPPKTEEIYAQLRSVLSV